MKVHVLDQEMYIGEKYTPCGNPEEPCEWHFLPVYDINEGFITSLHAYQDHVDYFESLIQLAIDAQDEDV